MNALSNTQVKCHPLIFGTFLLTAAGFITRLLGFFYRIFLIRRFGAEAIGVYQLIVPVMAMTFALTASGLQTAISKLVAEQTTSARQKHVLLSGLSISLLLSLLISLLLYGNADYLSVRFLKEARTATLLRISALSVPMAAIHSCINGYFFGMKKAGFPAVSQLVEQMVRISSIYVLYMLCVEKGLTPTISFMALGTVFGEAASMVLSLVVVFFRKCDDAPQNGTAAEDSSGTYRNRTSSRRSAVGTYIRPLITISAPLCASRISIQLLQSIEAASLPSCLMQYGYEHPKALSLYGILTGMSLPFVLFPTVLTGSIAVMLLPIISEAQSKQDHAKIRRSITLSIRYSSISGILCTVLFLFLGNPAAIYLFHNPLAGHYIRTLSFLCPFMYIAGTLSSILNGLGKTFVTFLISTICMVLRLIMLFAFVPTFGMEGYLWCILASQILQTVLLIKMVCRK